MPPKYKSGASAGPTAKKRKTITMGHKVEIIKRSERGETPSSIGRAFGYSRSTIATILKDKARIMEHVKSHAPMNATIITKQRSGLIIEMERLLTVWIEVQNQRNLPISLPLVQEKARSLFNELKAARTACVGNCNEEFVASRGWFSRFKERANLRNIKVHGEASVDVSAASGFPKILKDMIDDGGYLPDQIFNVAETSLLWKKMLERIYILKEENSPPGYQASKDRLTLLLGSNASGDLKLKPLVVHHSLNPRALHNVTKTSLPVIWRANPKAWVTAAVFQEWFLEHFVPAVELYCLGKSIPFRILLLLDHHSPGHRNISGDIHPNVKVAFLPPNTTSLLQPMDQGVIASFKAHYLRRAFSQAVRAAQKGEMTLQELWKNYSIHDAIKNIAGAWEEVKDTNMKGAWEKLCPQFTQGFLERIDDEIAETRRAVVAIGNELQLGISEDDIIELLESPGKELTNEEAFTDLEQQMIPFKEETPELEMATLKKFSTKKLADAFCLIEAGMAKLEEQDPDAARFAKAYCAVTDSLRCYRAIYAEKKKSCVQALFEASCNKQTPAAESDSDSVI
nr:tigger transposable element-derived protein 1-like isoform X2 [Anolis sagrei ordinatus]